MLDSHSWKWEMSPFKPRKPFSWGSTPIISCHVDRAWVLPSAHWGHCNLATWEESGVTSLCPARWAISPMLPGNNQKQILHSFFFFFLSFYTLYLTSHYLFQTWFSMLATVGPKEGWGNGLEWTGWLWIKWSSRAQDQPVLEALLCGRTAKSDKSQHIWSAYSVEALSWVACIHSAFIPHNCHKE